MNSMVDAHCSDVNAADSHCVATFVLGDLYQSLDAVICRSYSTAALLPNALSCLLAALTIHHSTQGAIHIDHKSMHAHLYFFVGMMPNIAASSYTRTEDYYGDNAICQRRESFSALFRCFQISE